MNDDVLEITFFALADDGEIYAPHAVDAVIGQRVPVGIGDELPEFMGTITAAEVVDHGKSLKITVKLDKSAAEPAEIARFLSGASKWAN